MRIWDKQSNIAPKCYSVTQSCGRKRTVIVIRFPIAVTICISYNKMDLGNRPLTLSRLRAKAHTAVSLLPQQHNYQPLPRGSKTKSRMYKVILRCRTSKLRLFRKVVSNISTECLRKYLLFYISYSLLMS